MIRAAASRLSPGRVLRMRGVARAAVVAAALACAPGSASAQDADSFASALAVAPDEKLLLEADQLVYNLDEETVTAVGGVEIYYGAYVLEAPQVTFHQGSGRLIASGGVRLIEPSGNVITAEQIDITDDFRDGFVQSLNVLTIDRAYFAAETAERRDGNLLILRKGVYTACEPCLRNPKKPPLWQIKAARIIHDQAARTIYYENARFEFLGVPIAYTPIFFHADPTVRRKTGFLTPSFRQSEAIGFGVSTPFFWNLAPNYDVTLTPTFLTRQGVLMEGEWRHRVLNGAYSIRAAGIFQADKDAFVKDGDELSGYRDFRGSLHSEAEFAINSRWTTGWDLTASTDPTFNRDYRISGLTEKDLPSTVFLTGLSDTNYFDLRTYYFLVQREDTEEEDVPLANDPDFADGLYLHDDQAEQAIVHPVLDHNYVLDSPIFGGELRFDSNLTSLTRAESDYRARQGFYAGLEGTYGRASSRASWRRQLIGPGGQVVTPFTYLQADVVALSADIDRPGDLQGDEFVGRAMPALGIQYEWPFLATIGATTHTFGPKAQLIVRPDEQHAGELPNEDAQSLVFDDTTLFEWDKFSGYDRQEGGTRLNIGLTYQGLLANGATIDALFGQSLHLAGENSFAEYDHALTGLGSGLDDDASDYVGRVTFNTGNGLAMTARGRFDDEDFSVNRSEITAVAARGRNVASLGYAYIRESLTAGVSDERQELSGGAVVALNRNWSVSGSLTYDIEADARVHHSIGLAYDDECFTLSATYSDTRETYSDVVAGQEIFFRLNLRTLGEGTLTSDITD